MKNMKKIPVIMLSLIAAGSIAVLPVSAADSNVGGKAKVYVVSSGCSTDSEDLGKLLADGFGGLSQFSCIEEYIKYCGSINGGLEILPPGDSDVPESPSPEAPEVSEDSSAPENSSPEVPEIPESSSPEVPETSEDSNNPETSSPDVPQVPEVSETPSVPETSEPSKPADPDNSGDSDSIQSVSEYEKRVVELVNEIRKSNGLNALKLNTELSNVARIKSQDMKDNGYFSHTSPTYGSPFDMIKSFGISYKTAGENIAMGYSTPEAVVNGWMNSDGHRKNILKPSYTEIGVGYVADGNYWTQMFIG